MSEGRPRKIPLLAVQVVGFVCLLVAVVNIRDGWYALGLFGIGLLTVAEVAHRQG